MLDAYANNTLQFNDSLCTGCGICLNVCPHGVFASEGRKVIVAHQSACMECGACQLNCPFDAIHVESGVGCASAMIRAALTGKKEAVCG
jgi:NAD-dependent dihydropyrimidine dehydrogenase PreA subunit